MRILVTGGAGFIGSNFVHMFYKKHDIVVYDKLTYAGNMDNLKEIMPLIEFHKGDVCNEEYLLHVMKGCDYVVHLSAESHVDRSIENPYTFTKTNVLGTHTLLDCARKLDTLKILHVSTDEVYGSRRDGYFTEGDALSPSSPYSASKVGGDVLAQAFHKTYGMNIVIARPSNNFGRRQYPEKLIPLFVTNIIDGFRVPVYGSGEQIRSWLHVDDTCRALMLLLESGTKGEIYNVGSSHEETNLDLTRQILVYLKRPLDLIKHVEDRKGHDFRYAVDSEKIKKLGWKRKNPFKEDLVDTIRWYQDNQQWWRKLKCTE